MLDYTTLMAVEPGQFSTFGFHWAAPYAVNAVDSFGETENVVTGGEAWSGEGQPAASTVMRTNALGLEAAKLQMRAGITAMDALATAIRTAQQKARDIVSELSGLTYSAQSAPGRLETFGVDVQVSPDGVLTFGPESPAYTYLGHELLVANLEMTSVMIYARSADLSTKQLLSRIEAAKPVFTTNVSARALAYNKAVHAIASSNLVLANLSLQTWQDKGPLDWRPVDDDTFDVVEAFKSFLPIDLEPGNLEEDAANLAKDQAKSQGLNALEKYLPAKYAKAVPWIGHALSAVTFVSAGKQTPHLTNDRGPTSPFEPPEAHDDDLDVLGHRYFNTDRGLNLTVTQAARLDAIGALGDDGGRDYVQEARTLEEDLKSWQADLVQDELYQHEVGLSEEANDLDGFNPAREDPYVGPNGPERERDDEYFRSLVKRLDRVS